MNVTERFSQHLKNVLSRAIHLATDLNHKEVTPLHLFYCLNLEKGSVAGEILKPYQINLPELEKTLSNLNKTPNLESEDQINKKSATVRQMSPFAESSKSIMEKSIILAERGSHNYLGTEHLLKALLDTADPEVNSYLKSNKINIQELTEQIDIILQNISRFPKLDEAADISDTIKENLGEMAPPPEMGISDETPPTAMPFPLNKRKKRKALVEYATCLTDPVAQKNIDPVIGRKNEVERLIQIIGRRTKNNPILLGDPGVGKTAIVEGLAKKIVEGKVPDILKGKKIYAIDMGLLIAGTVYRGEFESRLKKLIDEAAKDENIILFIDELHNIVGAGSNQGTMDAANLLKPALARGMIRCIGSTTPIEFKKYIESDPALERRFQPIHVAEPSIADTIKILKGVKKNYESYHHVKFSDESLEAAVKLSARHISGKFLPDKAIDLLDETASAKKVSTPPSPEKTELNKLKNSLQKIRWDKEKAALDENFGTAIDLKEKENKIKKQIVEMENKKDEPGLRPAPIISTGDIIAQISKIIGTEPGELIFNQRDKFKKIAEKIKRLIIGQNETVEEVVGLVQQAQLGISNPDKPLCSFLFAGESGVGKTEFSKVLAETLYPNQSALVRLDMSEFNESFGVSKLLGSPAGYVGFKEANQFTDKIKLNPYSVVLFDEVDKAHPQVLKILLQILENGEITDATGKKISLKHAIIILTTSHAAARIRRQNIGFGQMEQKNLVNKLLEELKNKFSPELINRLDKICLFNNLTNSDLVKIAQLEIRELNKRLKKFNTCIKADHRTLTNLVATIPETKKNARDIRRYVRNIIESKAGELILSEQINPELKLVFNKQQLNLA